MSEFGCQLYKEVPTADFSQDQITCSRRVLFKDVCVCVCERARERGRERSFSLLLQPLEHHMLFIFFCLLKILPSRLARSGLGGFLSVGFDIVHFFLSKYLICLRGRKLRNGGRVRSKAIELAKTC